jgi:hypothetical protein
MKDTSQKSWGELAFLFGIALAIVLSFFPDTSTQTSPGLILAVLGVIVGLFNITYKETHGFLVASIVLLLVGSAGLDFLPYIGGWLGTAFINISHFVAPAAMVVAFKTVIELARNS